MSWFLRLFYVKKKSKLWSCGFLFGIHILTYVIEMGYLYVLRLRLWRSSIFEDRSDPDPFKNQPIYNRSDPIRDNFFVSMNKFYSLLNYGLSDRFFCVLEQKTANSLNVIETRVEKNELITNKPIKIKDGVDKKYFLRILYLI